MLKLSFSQIKLYKSYPLDYFYRYVQRLPEKGTETKWSNFGSGVHQVLEDYYSGNNHNWQDNIIKRYDEYKLKGRMKLEDFKKNIVNAKHYVELAKSYMESCD
jgi:RecB family exonuclease